MGNSGEKGWEQRKNSQKYIELGNASEAYRQSYDAGKMKPETIYVKASQFLAEDKIRIRIKELRNRLVEKHEVTVESIAQELEKARTMALTTPN